MWISKYKYDRIIARLNALEEETSIPIAPTDLKVGRVVKMLLDHFGLHVERPMCFDRLAQKGGPERGSQ